MAEPRLQALEALLDWWVEQGGEPGDARGIADWLWLNASLQGRQLPRSFVGVGGLPASDEPVAVEPERGEAKGLDVIPIESGPAAPAPPDPHAPSVFPPSPAPAAEPKQPAARLLSAALLPNDGDVREQLRRRTGAVPLLLSQMPLLQRPLPLLMALRPLLQKQPHRRWRLLDEERTAERSADLGRPWPVFGARKLPAVEVHLWLDAGVAMAVWRPLAQDLRHLLAGSQAFARVELHRIPLEQLSSAGPMAGRGCQKADGTALHLVLSDTAGRHWWDGTVTPWLQGLAREHPVAILHTLPLRYQARTALRRGESVTLSNGQGLGPNSGYQAVSLASLDPRRRGAAAALPHPEGLKLPVLSLDPRDLAPWAALVMGDPLARSGGTVLPPVDRPLPRPAPIAQPDVQISPGEAETLWLAFRQQASPEAQRLMRLMAAAPLLTLPVLRLLLVAELPDLVAPLPLAEVLVSGLVHRCDGGGGGEMNPDLVQFALLPAVRELLEAQLEPHRRVEVIRAITDLLERHWNQQGRGPSFQTLLTDPRTPLPEGAEGLVQIANVTAAMLDRLPGQPFRELAQELRTGTGALPPPLWPASVVFEEEPFETAQLVDTPALEVVTVFTARWQELPLQPISFPTLGPADLDRFLRQVDREGGEAARASLPKATAWAFHEPLQREGLAFGATAERSDPLALTLVEIPAGRFLMGSPVKEAERLAAEGPQHAVTLEHFFLSQTPITQAQWRAVAQWQPRQGEAWGRELDPEPSYFQPRSNAKARAFRGGRFGYFSRKREVSSDLRPVENVSWEDAMEFCNRLSQRTGRSYTLPSEAQWEYACRAESSTPFAFGETLTPELANYDYTYDKQTTLVGMFPANAWGLDNKQTTSVGMFPANAWGLYDMHGNVREWCLDHWHDSYEGASTDGSAWLNAVALDGQRSIEKLKEGTNDLGIRLLRGGSWNSFPRYCRSACRSGTHPDYRDGSVGFRVCCLPWD